MPRRRLGRSAGWRPMIGRNRPRAPRPGTSHQRDEARWPASPPRSGAGRLDRWPRRVSAGATTRSRQEIARIYTLLEIARCTEPAGPRPPRPRPAGPGPEVSTGKLAASDLLRQLRDVGSRRAGPTDADGRATRPLGGMLQRARPCSARPSHRRRHRPDPAQHHRRAGPRPARRTAVDKDVPFAELKVGTQRDNV